MTGIELARILLENPDKEVVSYSTTAGYNIAIYTAEYSKEVDQIVLSY